MMFTGLILHLCLLIFEKGHIWDFFAGPIMDLFRALYGIRNAPLRTSLYMPNSENSKDKHRTLQSNFYFVINFIIFTCYALLPPPSGFWTRVNKNRCDEFAKPIEPPREVLHYVIKKILFKTIMPHDLKNHKNY